MIISHEHKFIFIKTRKTGGTSVEISLSRYCGPNDVLTPISVSDEPARAEFGRTAQNHSGLFNPFSQMDGSYKSFMRAYRRFKRAKKYYNHIPAWMVRRLVGERVWSDYLVFTVERHPMDRLMSLYYWHTRSNPDMSLDAFIGTLRSDRHMNAPLYTEKGEVIVDMVIDHAHLTDGLREVGERCGFDFDGWMPNAKGGHRKDKRSAEELLTPELRERVALLFGTEFDALGYRAPHLGEASAAHTRG